MDKLQLIHALASDRRFVCNGDVKRFFEFFSNVWATLEKIQALIDDAAQQTLDKLQAQVSPEEWERLLIAARASMEGKE